ncbi:calreticulin [Rhynchophorus ferrugineus]|uniref:calreticulin n=1 Tax=Rhynchophorus ferrugineus TaxID=354439 RepID=UPI003FCD4C15
MKRYLLLAVVAVCALLAHAGQVYFEEKFSDDSWEKNWIYSKHPGKEFGKFVRTAGKFFVNEEDETGIQTSEDARFYALSTKFAPFNTEGKDLVIQFTVKHEQNIDCGGGYVKVFDCSLKPEDLHGETPYRLMFGPDICGPGTKKVHVILNHNDKNHLINKDIRCKDDDITHAYTLIIHPDNTYQVLIDNEEVQKGDLESDWDILPPKKIKDPEAKKPEDWDDRATIPDPDDTKPEDWDKPEHIPDPAATKPDDWDDEMDGEWEPAMIDNPEYKGEWKPKQIDNPAYKGAWVHPEIDNPEYSPVPDLYKQSEICGIGFDLWQVKSGTIFDNVLITDDVAIASKALENLKEIQEGEKKVKEEKNKEEAEAEKSDESNNDESEDDDDDDDAEDHEPKVEENHDEL